MTNLSEIQATLSKLYDGVNGYDISHADRSGAHKQDKAFTYGEMLFEPFARIMAAVKPAPGDVFYDLGSGTGKVLIMADQLYEFASVTGIEFLPTLHATATDILHRYCHEFRSERKECRGPVVSKHGDMLVEDLSNADIIFVHATCMPAELIDSLGEKVRKCKPTARFILVSRGFFGSPWFNCVEQIEYTNAWKTQSICYIYQLKPQAAVAARAEAVLV